MKISLSSILVFLISAPFILQANINSENTINYSLIFIWIVVILLSAKISSLIEKVGMPSVLGELCVGIALGNLAIFGFPYLEGIKGNEIISFLAQLGVVILLFQIGLESNISKLLGVGIRAIGVAFAGVLATFLLIWVALPFVFPNLSPLAYIFFASTFVSTSVGISARVFKDLKKSDSEESRLVLSSAVLDDVLGLIVLAIATALVTNGNISTFAISTIALKAIAFLVLSIVIGHFTAPAFGKVFSKIHTGVGMKFTIAISFALVFAFFAEKLGLAPIIGAFAAGLVLDPVHFESFRKPRIVRKFEEVLGQCSEDVKRHVFDAIDHHKTHDIEDLVEPLGLFLIPIFFVLTGMAVDLKTFTDPKIFLISLILTALAIAGKLIAGLIAKKGQRVSVGWGLVPRGEVQLIFATVGLSLGILNEQMYTTVVLVVLLTSLITPIVLPFTLKKKI